MKRLQFKLIFILVIFSLLLVLLNMMVVNWSFDRGFDRYLQKQRYSHVEQIAESLALRHHSVEWQGLMTNRNVWRGWLKDNSSIVPSGDRDTDDESERRSYRFKRNNEAKKPPHKSKFINQELELLDANKKLVHEKNKLNKKDRSNNKVLIYVPVISAKKTIAYLAYPKENKLLDKVKRIFLIEQLKASFLTVFIGFIISLILAYFLAKRLLKPIEQISATVRAAANNDYTQRALVNGRDELSQLADDVNQLSLTLHEQQQAQQRWMSDMAHELRTPLAILKAQLEALEDGVRKFDSSQLSLLQKETNYLQNLVNDMRELNLSERGSLTYSWQSLDIKSFLIDAHQSWEQSLAPELEFELLFEGQAYNLLADPNRLKQLTHNLVQNSQRYTQQPGKIRLSCNFKNDKIVLCWEDSSPGVESENHDKLFNRLYRVDNSRNREIKGSGIGLAICKNIIEAHQGAIKAHTSELGGLAITIELPRKVV